jgi:purine-binding chemotaxis protein CheW
MSRKRWQSSGYEEEHHMTDEQIINVPPSGSVGIHPSPLSQQAVPAPARDESKSRASGRSATEGAIDNIQVVEFLLGDEHFAIDLFEVREVVEYTRITHLPDTPPYIRGIIDLRGEITTIIDLKHQLHINTKSQAEEAASRIIVLDDRITRSKIGIMVDDVLSVSTFSRKEVDTTAATVNRERNNIIWIIRKKIRIKDKDVNELIIWIDIQRLLKDVDQEIVKEGYGTKTGA